MTTEIPTVEPAELVAGDTWTWKRSLGDYPAGEWTLTYYFRAVASEFSVVCTADGTDHLATVAASTSAGKKAGRYEWTAVVTSGSSRYTVGRGQALVKPDPASTGAGFDPRSHARKTLEALEAVIEGKATRDQKSYTIGGRALERMPVEEILKFKDHYAQLVAAEEAGERLAAGQPGAARLLARL
jgi:hypothetical protein